MYTRAVSLTTMLCCCAVFQSLLCTSDTQELWLRCSHDHLCAHASDMTNVLQSLLTDQLPSSQDTAAGNESFDDAALLWWLSDFHFVVKLVLKK